MDREEGGILEALDRAVASETVRPIIEAAVTRLERWLRERPDDDLAWEPIPLDSYAEPIPESIRSSWVFVLRANTSTGAERHPNSHQRMMSYRGSGDLQTRPERDWCSHPLTSDRSASIAKRWVSIPALVWHQGVVPEENWVVVSFHTVAEQELIEERPAAEEEEAVHRRAYLGDPNDDK
jgi:hypothetical protein